MYGQTFRLEDLTLQIPQKEGKRTTTKSHRSIYGGRTPYQTTKSFNYNFIYSNADVLLQLKELCNNPAYSCVPIYELTDRINTAHIDTSSRQWQYGISDIPLKLTRGYGKFLFVQENIERDLHDRWKILISEDFFTDGIWPANANIAVSPFQSLGDSNQTQDIYWTDVAGDWETDTDLGEHLSGDQCFLHNDDVAAMLVAGWDWWDHYEVEAFFQCADSIADDTGIIFRYVDSTHHYRFMNTATSSIGLYNNATAILIDTSLTLVADVWYHMKVRVQGNRIQCFLNGTEIFDHIDKTYTSGRAGLYSELNNTYFDNFKVTLLPPPNFNLPASTDWTNQYVHSEINTAHGTQKKLIAPDNNVQFKQSRAGDDCILYLPLNEGQGNPKDHSKNNYAMTNHGATWYEDEEKGWCMSFDGGENRLYTNISPILDSSNYLTVDFEIYIPSEMSGTDYYVCLMRLTIDRFLWMGDETYLRQIDDIDDEGGMEDLTTYTQDTWHRWTTIFNDSWIIHFLDGRLVFIYENPHGDSIEDIDADYIVLGGSDYDGGGGGLCRMRNFRMFDAVRWDVAFGHDSTPAMVFVHDTNQFDPDVAYPDYSDCVGLWRFDEGAGTDTDILYDASGKGHDATITDLTGWSTTSFRGEAGTCPDFELTNTDYLTVANHADFSFAGDVPFSLGVWIKLESIGILMMMICKDDGGAGREWEFYIDTNNYLNFILIDADGDYIGKIYSTALSVNTWYHVVGTYDGSEVYTGINIYLNGVLVTTTTNSGGTYVGMTAGAAAVTIGARSAPDRYFDGLIDNPCIDRKELSAEEVAARYRSEPYGHDYYQMTRVYDKSHQFKGLPVINNGLIMLSFPDYDIYEERTANILLPAVYGWYENSWHLLGYINPRVKLNGTAYYLDSVTGSEWEITELTDQLCTIRITYMLSGDANIPEGTRFDIWYTIRNGYPGILIETTTKDWMVEDTIGYYFEQLRIAGMTGYDFSYIPEDILLNAAVDTTSGTQAAGMDDNWLVHFYNRHYSNAPNKNVIVGHVTDNLYDDLGGNHAFQTLIANNKISGIYNYGHRHSSIFFVPYDVDDLFRIADTTEDGITGDGDDDQNIIAGGSQSDGEYLLNDALEYVQWQIDALTTLPKGTYMAIVRVASTEAAAGDREGIMNVDNDNDRDGDLATKTFTVNAANIWEDQYLLFYTDGTSDVYISIECFEATDEIYVDFFVCVPLANAINYPSDIAHQAFNETNLIRGLKK